MTKRKEHLQRAWDYIGQAIAHLDLIDEQDPIAELRVIEERVSELHSAEPHIASREDDAYEEGRELGLC